jgi:hypothetical protein
VTAAPNGGLNQDAATWLSYLDSVITCAEGIATTARIKRAEGDDAACLLARSVSTARAVVHLIGLGHVVEARMLARSVFENKFYLYRLARDGSAFAREMFAAEVYHRGARGDTMFKEEQAREAMGEESRARRGRSSRSCAKKTRTRRRSIRRTPSPVPISGPPTRSINGCRPTPAILRSRRLTDMLSRPLKRSWGFPSASDRGRGGDGHGFSGRDGAAWRLHFG